MGKIKIIISKVLYGSLFLVVIPSLLLLWARYTNKIINIPVPGNKYAGYVLLVAGISLMITGILHLWIIGKGLPMNAFPPEKFVKKGIFAIIRHPIYSGTALTGFGLSIVLQSSSGFWLVCPLFILMLVSYVAGFENERTIAVFGRQDYKTFLSRPDPSDQPGEKAEKIAAYFLVFVPWLLIYEALIFIDIPKDAITVSFTFESTWPVWEFSGIFYLANFLFVLLVPVSIRSKRELREFITDIWFATIIAGIICFVFPFTLIQKDFVPHSIPGKLILLQRAFDGGTAVLPSFSVIWAFIAAHYYAIAASRQRWFWYLIAILISVSCITTGNQSLAGVFAGFGVFMITLYRKELWDLIRVLAERIANSWREWRFGRVRIINHGFYGGASGFTGTLIAGSFLGVQYYLAFVIVLFIIAGAGLWAQIIEGSSKLLRPYGYYGGLLGLLFGSLLVYVVFPVDFFTILGAFAMAGPWIQCFGRLRCLVQGCCHGKPSPADIGIRFTHPYSRVNKISGLKGVPLHPTQIYSIGCNLISGLILIRLYNLQMPSAFIAGIYLILNGCGRFVEESFRGEAQTPYWAGMRIYQWIAIINIIVGASFTIITNNSYLNFHFSMGSILLALAGGIVVTLASGVDFPESERRFARLTSR